MKKQFYQGEKGKPPYWSEKYIKDTENLSKEKYSVKIEKNRSIVVKDGTRLKVDIYRPDTENGQFPALVGWTPFGKEVQSVGREREGIMLGQVMFEQGIEIGSIDYFVKRGYLVVIPNPRGISTSEGEWTGILSQQDQLDCYDVIEWAAKQHWCSGNVGMIGIGYSGKIQSLVAALQPPHLKAIMPIDLMDDLYLDSYPGGIVSDINYPLCSYIPAINSISEAELTNTPERLKEMLKECRENQDIATNSYYYRGLDSWPPRHYTWNIDVLLHPLDGEFWEKRSQKNKNIHIKVPTYAVALYYEYGRATISAFNAFNDPNLDVPKKLMIAEPHINKCLPYGFANEEMLRWYDYWLKGIETGIMDEPPIKFLVMGENKFRYEEEWPLARTKWTKAYLKENGVLDFEAEIKDNLTPDVLKHTPPTMKSQMPEEVPALKYTMAPFEKDVEITGPVAIDIYAAIDVNDGNFTAKIWDKSPDGSRLLLSLGYLRASHRKLDKAKSKPWMPVNNHTKPEPVEPNKIYNYKFELAPISNVFKSGHNIEIEIKAMDQQYYSFTETASLPRLYTSGRVAGPHPSAIPTIYNIYHDKNYDSHILLPIIENTPEDNWIY